VVQPGDLDHGVAHPSEVVFRTFAYRGKLKIVYAYIDLDAALRGGVLLKDSS
jgi:hypothetical protein